MRRFAESRSSSGGVDDGHGVGGAWQSVTAFEDESEEEIEEAHGIENASLVAVHHGLLNRVEYVGFENLLGDGVRTAAKSGEETRHCGYGND